MKKLLSITLTIALLLNGSLLAFAEVKTEATPTEELAPNVRSAILIERDTGSVLYEKKMDEPLPPASMTKIMTMVLIMEALDKGQFNLNEKVRTSEYAASMGGSQIFLEPGEEMTVKQMLYGIAVGSANDACVAMAEKIAGSEKSFVARMNERAKQLGLKNTHFENCTGLPAENHYSSARDMALMGKELLNHKLITQFTGTYESYLREDSDKKFWLVNTNKLVKFYPGVDGLKTGFTQESKYCLTATAEKNGMRVIAVVFGAENPKERNLQVSNMLDFAFNQYTAKKLFKKGENIALVPISKGSQEKTNLVSAEDISILAKKGEDLKLFKPRMVVEKNVQAPLEKGQALGKIMIEKDGKIVSTTELVTKQSVPHATWFQLYKRSFAMFTKVTKK
ncbi:MAG: D-alanyl-D-alanine carboxypeptidase [Bacillales bacterium]|nr:D-alanyl-D-alanine carboxypeptidase [Bacillales bacterium]